MALDSESKPVREEGQEGAGSGSDAHALRAKTSETDITTFWLALVDVLTSYQHDPGTIPIKSIDVSLSSKGTLRKSYLNYLLK